ncbi:MAG: protease inhibitor I42 family protein [Proteobacteria bacterium]|nr:protease inhibitor I42 family protein [Pseudomonadota bacterium]MCL2306921.1 protease inhibitor I42 family protein [Pseudomonadota bacterium]
MKFSFSTLCIAALTTMVLAGCASKPAEPEKTLSLIYGTVATEALNGADIPLEVGQQLEVRLQGNRSTGHQWVQTEPMRGMLRDASPRYELPPTPEGAEPRVGVGGTEIFSFVAARPGVQVLVFEYRRSWESSQEASKRVYYRVVVH